MFKTLNGSYPEDIYSYFRTQTFYTPITRDPRGLFHNPSTAASVAMKLTPMNWTTPFINYTQKMSTRTRQHITSFPGDRTVTSLRVLGACWLGPPVRTIRRVPGDEEFAYILKLAANKPLHIYTLNWQCIWHCLRNGWREQLGKKFKSSCSSWDIAD